MYAFTAVLGLDIYAKIGEGYPKTWRKSTFSRKSLGYENVIASRYTLAYMWLTYPRECANAEHIFI